MRTMRTIAAALVMAAAATTLAACSSDDAATTATAVAAASEAAESTPAGAGGTPEMTALCDQMVAEGLTPEEATALATENGYVARVGSIDGEQPALTMDLREDRFTFEVANGVVVGCTYG